MQYGLNCPKYVDDAWKIMKNKQGRTKRKKSHSGDELFLIFIFLVLVPCCIVYSISSVKS